MREVARELNLGLRTMYVHHPQICKEIARRHKEKLKREKSKRIEADCERVNEIVHYLYERGTYPSRRRVEEEAGLALLRREEVQRYWKHLISSLSS